MKYKRSTTSGCKDKWKRKSDFDYFFLFRAWREKESAKGEEIDERQDKSINQLYISISMFELYFRVALDMYILELQRTVSIASV